MEQIYGFYDIATTPMNCPITHNIITEFYQAAEKNDLATVKKLISHEVIITEAECKETALFKAAGCDALDIVKYLTPAHISIRSIDNERKTALHFSSENHHLNVIEYLLHQDPTLIDLPDEFGNTLLHLAVKNKNLKIVKYLATKGANLHLTNYVQETPLYIAASAGSFEIVQYLLQHGALVNFKNRDEKTALHISTQAGNLAIIKYLIKKSAFIDIIDRFGMTPFEYALARGNAEAAQFLILKGALTFKDGKDLLDTILNTEIQSYFKELRENLYQGIKYFTPKTIHQDEKAIRSTLQMATQAFELKHRFLFIQRNLDAQVALISNSQHQRLFYTMMQAMFFTYGTHPLTHEKWQSELNIAPILRLTSKDEPFILAKKIGGLFQTLSNQYDNHLNWPLLLTGFTILPFEIIDKIFSYLQEPYCLAILKMDAPSEIASSYPQVLDFLASQASHDLKNWWQAYCSSALKSYKDLFTPSQTSTFSFKN